jgi:hypothetical protein
MKDGMSSVKRRIGSSDDIEDMKAADLEHEEHIEECVETLLRAEEIKADSKLMEEVWPILEKKKDAAIEITSFKDLRKLAGKKATEEYDDKVKGRG